MYPPIFETVSVDPDIQLTFGTNPIRVFPFGESPQNPSLPYAVWQVISGSPENCLDQVPNMDLFSLQIDVYSLTVDASRDGAMRLRDAIEPYAHVVSWRGESRDPDTLYYVSSFDVDWWTTRLGEST